LRSALRKTAFGFRVTVMSIPLVLITGMVVAIFAGKHRKHLLPEIPAASRIALVRNKREVVSRLSHQKQLAAIQGLYCFNCHNLLSMGESTDGTIFSHLKHLDRGFHCEDCHRDLGKKKHGPVPMKTCLECHDGKQAPNRCTLCHSDPALVLPGTHGAGWLEHHEKAGADASKCTGCHKQAMCIACHRPKRPESHSAGFVGGHGHLAPSIVNPLKPGVVASPMPSHARQRAGRCTSCHVLTFCESCHKGAIPSSHRSQTFMKQHGGLAAQRERACFTCHSTQFCRNCHRVAMPHPKNYLPRIHKEEAQKDTRSCGTCHEKSWCTACHKLEVPHPQSWMREHGAVLKVRGDVCSHCHKKDYCEDCHKLEMRHPAGYREAHLEAARQNPQLCAKCHHADACTQCHGLELPHPKGFNRKPHGQLATKSPQLCGKCHPGSECTKCHDVDNMPESHDEDDFANGHAKQAAGHEALCALCHGKTGCADCHKKKGVKVALANRR